MENIKDYDKFFDENKESMIDELKKKCGNFPCHRCGNNGFILVKGIFKHNNYSLEENIPSFSVICDNCSCLTHHAIGVFPLSDRIK